MAVGILSSTLFATGEDGDRATHTLPHCMPLCSQVILFMGTAATLHHLPPPVVASAAGELAPSAMREIAGLIDGGFAHMVSEDEAVWQASLFGVDKVKRSLPDPTGELDSVEGSVSKHFRADLAQCPDFCGAHGVLPGCWKEQRNLLVGRIHKASSSAGTDEAIRGRVKREMGRYETWWVELHTSEADEVRVVFNQKGEVNDAYQTMGSTMMGPALALSMCSTGATLMTKDERKGYYQVKTSRAHSLLLSMRLPGGGFACWVRAPMGNRKSSDDFVQQVTFTKMILSCLDPWRAAHTRRNTPEMAGGPSERYDPHLPIGFYRTDSRGREVASYVTFADDWFLHYPDGGTPGRGERLALMGTQASIEVGYTTGRHLHRTKGDGPAKMVPYTGFELCSQGGLDDLAYLRAPEMKQANGCIRTFNLALQCGVDLLPLVNRHLPSDMEVGAALSMTRGGSELHVALRRRALAQAVRRDIAKAVGFFNHLAAVVPVLAACMRSISSCIYDGVSSGSQMPSTTVDWDSVCTMSTRAWLDLARALWVLKREAYHKIMTKCGAYGMLAIQDAAEELGGGFVAEIGPGASTGKRMRVFHGPHAPAERHMTSGPKELCFIRNGIREATKLWGARVGVPEHRQGSEAERQFALELIDPGRDPVRKVCRLLVFTDSTVSVCATRKGYSKSPEMAAIVEEIELLLMDFGLQLCIKHISGKTMIRLHVDGASRGDAGPLLRIQDARSLHPFLIHRWGLTERLKCLVVAAHPDVIFINERDDIDWVGLAGHTFCFSPHPESLVPIAMRALDVWSTRPYSTTAIMLVARDFGTWGLRPIMRQFDQVQPGVRYQRVEAEGDDCIWDTMWLTKGPLKRAPVGNKEITQRHRELLAVRREARALRAASQPTRGGEPSRRRASV
jgi:hypothetical protein